MADQNQEFVPDSNQEFVPDKPSILSKVWQAVNTPAVNLRSGVMGQATEEFAKEHPYIGTTANFIADLLSGQTSPLGLGLTAVTGGANLAEKGGFEAAARLLHTPGKIAAAGMLGQGGYNLLKGDTTQDKVRGGFEAVLGGLGLRGLSGKPLNDNIELSLPPKREPLYLPLPRGKSAPIGKGFVHGQEGIAENRPYVIDTTAVNKGSGTVLPREAGEVTQVPPEIAATYGTGLGKSARAPLEDRYTGYSPVKQLTGMPEQNQLNPASGFNALGKDIIPQVDPLDISNPPQPESFKQQPYDINAYTQSLIDANQKGIGNEPPTSDLGSMLKEFEPQSAEQPVPDLQKIQPDADTPAGTMTPDAQNLIEKGANSKYDINAHIQQLTDEIKNKNQSVSNQEAIPEFGNKLQEFIQSEEGSVKLDKETIQNVKEKITNAIRSSQRIILPDIFNRVKDQVTRKQFDRIIDQMLSSNEVNSQVSNKQAPINSTTDYVRNPTEAISKLTNALREAAPLREQQEQLYTTERGKRIAAAQAVKTPGLAGIYQRFGKLKGELPKVDYAGLKLNKVDVDNLADAITNNTKITEWEKMNAREGMLKILTGSGVPQRSELALLSRVFGPEFSNVVQMHGGIGLVGSGISPIKALTDINAAMKTMMSTMDASFPLRQGGGLIHQGEWFKSFANMWKMASSDRVAYKNTMDAVESKPKYLMGRAAGLDTTSLEDLTTREEAFPMHNIVEKIPGVGASERMAMGFINKLRADVFDKWTDLAKDAGLDLGTAENPSKLTRDIAKVINNSTGRGSLGKMQKIAPELNQVFYSPKFIASRLTMLNPAYYTSLEPFARKEALKSALAIAGSDILVNGLFAAMGAKVGSNILSSDFMKAKMDNTRVENSSGFQSYLVALTRFLKGETDSSNKYGPLAPTRASIASNFVVNKFSPLASLITTLAMGSKNKEGDLTKYGRPINIPYEVSQRFMSMFPKDIYDLYQDDPNLFPLGEAHFSPKLGAIPLSMLGAGVQTYDNNANKSVSRFRLR